MIDNNDQRLTDFVLGELDSSQQSEIEALIKTDPQIAAAVAELRQTIGLIGNAFESEPKLELSSKQKSELLDANTSGNVGNDLGISLTAKETPQSESLSANHRPQRSKIWWVSLAAVLSGLLVGGWVFTDGFSSSVALHTDAVKAPTSAAEPSARFEKSEMDGVATSDVAKQTLNEIADGESEGGNRFSGRDAAAEHLVRRKGDFDRGRVDTQESTNEEMESMGFAPSDSNTQLAPADEVMDHEKLADAIPNGRSMARDVAKSNDIAKSEGALRMKSKSSQNFRDGIGGGGFGGDANQLGKNALPSMTTEQNRKSAEPGHQASNSIGSLNENGSGQNQTQAPQIAAMPADKQNEIPGFSKSDFAEKKQVEAWSATDDKFGDPGAGQIEAQSNSAMPNENPQIFAGADVQNSPAKSQLQFQQQSQYNINRKLAEDFNQATVLENVTNQLSRKEQRTRQIPVTRDGQTNMEMEQYTVDVPYTEQVVQSREAIVISDKIANVVANNLTQQLDPDGIKELYISFVKASTNGSKKVELLGKDGSSPQIILLTDADELQKAGKEIEALAIKQGLKTEQLKQLEWKQPVQNVLNIYNRKIRSQYSGSAQMGGQKSAKQSRVEAEVGEALPGEVDDAPVESSPDSSSDRSK